MGWSISTTCGRIVTVQTDHKPILGLTKKPYNMISPRLQRMLLRLNKHNIQLEYVPGKNLVIADALSRAQSTTDNFDEVLIQEATVRINLLTQTSPTKWEEIASLTAGDPEMQDVLFHINNGWPQKKIKIAAQPYWHCKEELYSTKEGIICRGQQLVVPVKYRKEILKLLHVSHKGIVSIKIKAREYFYWPNLNRDVEEYVSKCKICQKYQKENQKEILINPEIPDRPWIQPAKDLSSPAELLMGRKLRTFLPSHPGQLKPTFDVERAREAF
ncbi:retrovirus-related Pol polyprotein from transposon 17.6 [Trichonephila clavipes]|nr:retrovirus-related Pol polyprotein from transposon 17.6 [Trichonephila clavipes]